MSLATEKSKAESNKVPCEVQKHLTKTKVCSLFLEGKCFYGSKCFYAHSVTELREQPNLFKTSLCKMHRKGMCTSGATCKYAHGTKELKATHKTVMCLWWLNGRCSHGEKCRFAHGEAEIQTRKNAGEAEDKPTFPAAVPPPPQPSPQKEMIDWNSLIQELAQVASLSPPASTEDLNSDFEFFRKASKNSTASMGSFGTEASLSPGSPLLNGSNDLSLAAAEDLMPLNAEDLLCALCKKHLKICV